MSYDEQRISDQIDGGLYRLNEQMTNKMEPHKKKANELVERFRKYAKIGVDSPVTGRTENAIQCAIICVEEIINNSCMLCEDDCIAEWVPVLTELKSMV